ncbi:hypothetical protein HanPI659440_Chr10g0387641 [Helianthus annuus]|nr:hypothetical protein HanPI659440_Chr10g0387641 [Helianthus annuus]
MRVLMTEDSNNAVRSSSLLDDDSRVNEPVDIKEMEPIMEGVYVRVHGQLKGL